MTRFQKRLFFALATVLLVAVTLFRKGWFLGGDAGVWVYRMAAPVALLTVAYALGNLLSRRVGGMLALLLFLSEAFLFWMFRVAANERQLPHPVTEFLQNLYLLHCRDVAVHHLDRGRYDDELFYTLRPGTFQFSNFEFSTSYYVNSAGFRDDEASLHAPEVICLGDSYTMGWGVEQQEDFPSLLEKNLGRRVLNLGVASYGTARESLAFERLRSGKTKLIVLQYCPNDAVENRAFVKNDYHLEVSPPEVLREDMRWFRMLGTYFPLKYCHAALAEMARRMCRKTDPGKTGSRISGQALADFYDIIKKIKSRFGGKVVIFNMTPGPRLQEDAALRALFDKQPLPGVYFLPVAKLLSATDYFVLDDHLRASGHRKVAAALEALILKYKLLD
ncbi:MAG: SGNH/GDSL hydrolase family protein [Saprospiraceae bacterium]